MQKTTYDIVIFLIVATGLILFMATFIITIIFLYRKRQHTFEKNLVQLKLDYEKASLGSQLEIQEQTFQHISREIHDNINLSLTLAKLNLITMDWANNDKALLKVDNSIELLTQSIAQLSDMSKSLDADIINRDGLLSAVEEELQRIKKTGYFHVSYSVTGNPVYMNSQAELVIFRIIQEAFNNIIKHAHARTASLQLHYNHKWLQIEIADDGNGFDPELVPAGHHAGLNNMEARIKLLGGKMDIKSIPGQGSSLNFIIPFEKV
jgi:two-component system, NarL family, sensor kinase